MKKVYTIVLMIFFINTYVNAQMIENNSSTNRKIEILAYSSAEFIPNDIYVSFILKQYNENGRVIPITETLDKIKRTKLKMGCNNVELELGNIYGYVNTQEDGSDNFQHKSKYILRLNSLECVEQFVWSVNKFALESINIDEINVKFSDTIIRDLQRKAFEEAKVKADLFLSVFNEKSGKILEIQEINGNIIQPSSIGNNAIIKSIRRSDGIQYIQTVSNNSKLIKYEYTAKVIFEIK